MSKNYFKGIMRNMREFTAEVNSNKARYDRAKAKAAEDYAEAKAVCSTTEYLPKWTTIFRPVEQLRLKSIKRS